MEEFKIKVLQIITGNDNGGGGNHVLNLSYYSKKYFDVVLGCIGEGDLYIKAKNKGIKTILLTKNSFLNGDLEKYIKKENIDLINFHGAKAFFLHKLIKNKLSIKSVATIHSNYKEDFKNNKFKFYMFTPLSILGLKSFQNYICVSNYIKNLINKDKFDGNKFVVNNAIDFNSFCKNEYLKINKNDLNISKEDFIFSMIARMHPVKNHKNAIEAFYKLSREFKNIKLILLGDGSEKKYIEDTIDKLNLKHKVLCLGFKEDVANYISLTDVTLLTSFSEGGAPPIAILESGALKVPIIASEVSDIPDIINKTNGYLINPNSVEDIYNKMKQSYLNKDGLYKLGNNLYNDITNKYSMDNFCKTYFKHYQQILKKD